VGKKQAYLRGITKVEPDTGPPSFSVHLNGQVLALLGTICISIALAQIFLLPSMSGNPLGNGDNVRWHLRAAAAMTAGHPEREY